jgi:hypothetical protein
MVTVCLLLHRLPSPLVCCGCLGWLVLLLQVDVTSKTEGKIDNSHMLVKYDARLRDNIAVNVVQEVTDTVQVSWARLCWQGYGQGSSGSGGGGICSACSTGCRCVCRPKVLVSHPTPTWPACNSMAALGCSMAHMPACLRAAACCGWWLCPAGPKAISPGSLQA